MAVRPDGRVLVSLFDERRGDDTLLQLTRDGVPDPRFGAGGRVRAGMTVTALHLMRDGTVLLGGQALGARRLRPRMTRLTARGRPLRRFARGTLARRGFTGHPLAFTSDARGRIWTIVSDPFEVAVGIDRSGAAIARLTPDGRMNARFGRRGVVRLARSRRARINRRARVLALDRRGGLLVGGGEFRGGTRDPAYGCGSREDLCASGVGLAVWRLRR